MTISIRCETWQLVISKLCNNQGCFLNIVSILGISGNAKDPIQNRSMSFTGDLSRMSAASSQMSGMGSNIIRSIARLWCHECTRVFADRILLPEGELIKFFSNNPYYLKWT